MVGNDAFFQRKQAAAVLKHGVLRCYMQVFASKTGSSSAGGRVSYIDGYAGPGRYEPEDGHSVGSPGSPLLAAATADALANAGRDLRCTFIERDAVHAANLMDVLAREWRGGGTYNVRQGEVELHLSSAVAEAGAAPLLIFLDPFGTALRHELLIEQLLSRPRQAKTEVLLNFNIDSVRRLGGRLDEQLTPDAAAWTSREAALRRVDSFLGGEWWREVFVGSNRQDLWIDHFQAAVSTGGVTDC